MTGPEVEGEAAAADIDESSADQEGDAPAERYAKLQNTLKEMRRSIELSATGAGSVVGKVDPSKRVSMVELETGIENNLRIS